MGAARWSCEKDERLSFLFSFIIFLPSTNTESFPDDEQLHFSNLKTAFTCIFPNCLILVMLMFIKMHHKDTVSSLLFFGLKESVIILKSHIRADDSDGELEGDKAAYF